jgi:hypothetical protein
MTRSTSSITSNATKSKYDWISKLSCRQNETVDRNVTEEHVACSNESIETAYPFIGEEKKMVTNQSFKSFPICSIGCNKSDDETLCTISDRKASMSKDWSTFHSDCETVSNFGNQERCTENRASESTNGRFKGHLQLFDSRQNKMTNLEVLSPTLHLLHEVYIKKGPSGTGVYFLPSSKYPPYESLHVKSIQSKSKTDHNQNTDADMVQNDRMMFRQQMRYEAIKKELFENATIDSNSLLEYREPKLGREDYIEHANAVDVIGCHAVSLWNFIPNMDNFFLSALPENEIFNDGSEDERNSDGLSGSISTNDEQSISAVETESDSDFYNSIDDVARNISILNVNGENYDDTSFSGSFMDQSQIYLMTTNARKERAGSKKVKQSNAYSATRGDSFNRKKISELTIDIENFSHNSRELFDGQGELSVSNNLQSEDKNLSKGTIPDIAFGWARHFQRQISPYSKHQMEINHIQKEWLKIVFQSRKDENDSDSDSANQTKRRVEAQEALTRIKQKRSDQRCFYHLFD